METKSGSTPKSSRGPEVLTIRSFRDGDAHVVALAGELDLDTAPDVVRALAAVERAKPPEIAVDLRELTFIDSIGVRLLFNAHGRAAHGGYRLIVVRGPAAIERICGFCELANPLALGDTLTFVDTLPSEAPAPRAAAAAQPRGRTSERAKRASRSAASRRRAEQAALAVALRELRTGRGTRAS